MSSPGERAPAARDDGAGRSGVGRRSRALPGWLLPRSSEAAGSGRLRLVETTLLVLAGLLLATATVNDLSRQVGVNGRLNADLRTWRAFTGHAYRNLSVDQQLLGRSSTHEVVCGNTAPGAPKARVQLCLELWGPVRSGLRSVHGGWYLPPRAEDLSAVRYACFGPAREQGICSR